MRICTLIAAAVLFPASCWSVAAWAQSPLRPPAHDPLVIRATMASETYVGITACESCSELRIDLALYRAGDEPGSGPPSAYHMRETFYGTPTGEQTVDTNGVWSESPLRTTAQLGRAWMVKLSNQHPGGFQYLERVEQNDGELRLLDAQMQELPPDIPHTLRRVTGEHQLHMVILTEADDGRTIEMKAGEVFTVRLQSQYPVGYTWTSDRPDAMALLESGADPGSGGTSPAPPSTPLTKSEQNSADADKISGSKRTLRPVVPVRPQFQVWQLIAPPPGNVDVTFARRKINAMADPPVAIFTLTIVTR